MAQQESKVQMLYEICPTPDVKGWLEEILNMDFLTEVLINEELQIWFLDIPLHRDNLRSYLLQSWKV